jgi:predicted SprT family Zn-dependent metalloprotease
LAKVKWRIVDGNHKSYVLKPDRSEMTGHRQLVRDRACELMDMLGNQLIGQSLRQLGWSIRFDGGKRRLGACWCKSKMISLSGFYTDLAILDRIEEVIRHEIAHAIDWEVRGETDHGPEWKRMAIACGAKPTRLADILPRDLNVRYRLRCVHCGNTSYLFNKPKARRACGSCSTNSILSLLEVIDQFTGEVVARSGIRLQLSE